jgi:hypothetical protein
MQGGEGMKGLRFFQFLNGVLNNSGEYVIVKFQER